MIKHRSHLSSYGMIIAGVLFMVITPMVAHLLFSGIGYNPTDDGFTLAYARRMLAGQIPHRDFIIIRPFLSPILHLPVVMLGGDNMYWLSRLAVWMQLAWIAWCCAWLAGKYCGWPARPRDYFALAVTAFAFSINTFPVMAWHTIDGLFFLVTGMMLATMRRPTLRYAGYFLAAYAYLCKQSFIMAAPLMLFILGDWRNWKCWLAVGVPGLAYLLYLVAAGALPDALEQFQSHSSLEPIIERFLRSINAYIFWVYIALRMLHRRLFADASGQCRRFDWGLWCGWIVILLLPVLNAMISLYNGRAFSFGWFWAVAGIVVFALVEKPSPVERHVPLALLALLAGWSVAISIGAASPRLAGGLLAAVLMAQGAPLFRPRPVAGTVMLAVLAVSASFCLWHGRQVFVYMEQPAVKLTKSLDGVFPGGNRLYTNPHTYQFLEDLQQAVRLAEETGRPYAILPDVPGYWAAAEQLNPLSIDWAKDTELANPNIMDRLLAEIDAQRGQVTFIVQKYQAFPLRYGLRKLTDQEKFAVAFHVRRNFTKIAATYCFELYQ